MGEGEGGGEQDEDLLVPPPLHPLPHREGRFFARICLIKYELINIFKEVLDGLHWIDQISLEKVLAYPVNST